MQSSRSSERLLHLHSALAPAASATAAGGGTRAAFPPPPTALLEILAGLKDFDSPTIFNAVEKVTGDTTPSKCYTDHTIVNQLAELGSFIGFAVTVECTTNDLDDRVTAGENTFADYYQMRRRTSGAAWCMASHQQAAAIQNFSYPSRKSIDHASLHA